MQNSAVFCARSASAGIVTRYFSRCLIFWCFWIKPKARKKESKRIFFRSILRETILPLRLCVSCKERIYHLLSPKGGAKSVRQAKSSGNGRRMHLKRYSASSRPRFRRRIRRPFFFPFFRNAESVVRCAQRRLFIPLIEERQSAAAWCGGLHLVSAARKASSAGRELTDRRAAEQSVR